MSYRGSAYYPAAIDEHISVGEGHVHQIPPAALPTVPPSYSTPYKPLQLASKFEGPIAYSAFGTSTSKNSENISLVAGYTVGRPSNTASNKRKQPQDHEATGDKRLRQERPVAYTSVGRHGESIPLTASTFQPPHGTQHNPFEIESSPEPESIDARKSQKTALIQFERYTLGPDDSEDAEVVVQSFITANSQLQFYAVAFGHIPGIYTNWEDAMKQVQSFPDANIRAFSSKGAAWEYLEHHVELVQAANNRRDLTFAWPARTHAEFHARELAHSPAFLNTTHLPIPRGQTPVPQPFSSAFESSPMPELHGLSNADTRYGQLMQPFQSVQLQTSRSALQATILSDPVVGSEPILSPEQQKVVDLILAGHNVFYTGSAGCGKSTILKAFVKQLHSRGKRVRIVAPTNLAALNVQGNTTWHFAGWTPDSFKKSLDKLMQAAHGKEVYERMDTTDVLVIDEISMVENLQFERLNHIMKASRGEKYGGGPFGGVQIIVTGDFCQLSPVKPFKYCIGCGWELIRDNKWQPKQYQCENKYCREDVFYDIDKWAFRSKAWEECNFKHVNLTEIHRQHDKKFISILQRIRTDGVILPNHANILLNHASETEDAIKLFARREDVDRINNENIAKIPSTPCTYKCVDHFDWKVHHMSDKTLEKNSREAEDGTGTLHALKEHRYEIFVQLKESMRVVLQANLEPGVGLVNGAQGAIIGFEPYDSKKLPRKQDNKIEATMSTGPILRGGHAAYAEQQIKLYASSNRQQAWPIVQFDNGITKTIYADCTVNELGNDEPYSLLSRTQIPLMAGYAITVHKSQGMTLDRVIVDLSRAFEPSQIYVALSRARSLKGLKVLGLPQRNLGGANAQVKEFFEKYLSKT